MGVHSFWEIVGPTARPVRLETLEEKKMAIDASIWIYQFLKAVRDNEGNAVKSSHITGFFRRICKLLYFGIKPVFVFDGGVPVLKRRTIQTRNEIRQGKRENAKKTARKLLALQMHEKANSPGQNDLSNLAPSKKMVYTFKPNDDWDLPEIEGFLYDKDDQRINPNYDEEKKKKLLMNASVDDIIDDMDLDSINPASKEFEELPKAVQYQILSKLRLKSRLRMGYTKEQLQDVFPNSLDFSKFQIDMVRRRNFYTQKIINVTGMNDGGASKLDDVNVRSRIAGQKDKEYKLTKTENGWTLGLDDQDGYNINQPILLDGDGREASHDIWKESYMDDKERGEENNDNDDGDEEDDFEWEDVDLKREDEPKDNFDYSLKAGRLPQFEQKKQTVGSQSFLDTRPHFESPLKQHNTNYQSKYIIDTDTPGFFEKQQLSLSKNRIGDDTNHEDNGEEEYLEQIEEIEMMEAMQKSKMEQYERQQKLKVEVEQKKAENQKAQEKIEKSLKQKTILPEPKNIQNSLNLANIANNDTMGAQDLNFILKKLPAMNTTSLLFGFQPEKSSTNVSLPSEKSAPQEKREIPAMPSWFSSGSQDMKDIYSQATFVDDKKDKPPTGDTEGYQLLNGFLNAEEIIKENDRTHHSVNEENIDNESEISIVEVNGSNKRVPEHIDISGSEEVVSTEQKNEIAKNLQPHNDDVSGKDTLKEHPIPINKPMVFNYEFMPDEEKNLVEDIRKETSDFEVFKNQELLGSYNTETQKDTNDRLADNAFIEDDLFEHQTRDKRDADEVTPEMVSEVQELLSRFGIPFITAPMEAEAQCAELLKLKLVDGIITDDSDVFLFGGTKIYKNLFQDKKYVEFYDSSAIKEKLGIDREQMIELALLLGSDYTTGIKSMGPVSSMEVLAEFKDLASFKKWYEEGQFDKDKLKKEDKFHRDLRKKLVRNEVVLDSDFPNAMVIDAYINPEVDHDKTPFRWSVPDLDMLRQFLQGRIGWSWEKTDEVLIPLIRDINKRKQQGHSRQMTLTDFFPSDFAANINNTRTKINMGKRITDASNKLKKQRLR